MSTITNAQAADAIRAHHDEMATALRDRVTALATTVRAGDAHADQARAVLEYLDTELLPHASAEEQALYPAGDSGMAALLVRAMRDEHLNLISHVDAFRTASDGIDAATRASAILALFDTHLHKENELLVPLLVADPNVSLAELLGGMHELLG